MSIEQLFTPEEVAYQQKIRTFMEEKVASRALDIDLKPEYPEDIIRGLLAIGMGGVAIPKEQGGLGMSYTSEILMHEEIGKVCPAIALMTDTHLFTMHIIAYCGSPKIDARYTIPGAKGEKLYSVAITEPAGSSNVGEWTTTVKDGGDCWILNGRKIESSNAPCADAFVTSAMIGDQLFVFMVDKENPGLRVGDVMPNMGQLGGCPSEVFFTDCKVPKEYSSVYPTMEQGGFGSKLGYLYLPAAGLGIMETCLEKCIARLSTRTRFGTPLASRSSISQSLVQMKCDVEMARGLLYNCCKLADLGDVYTSCMMAHMAKATLCELTNQTICRAMELHGNYGYQEPSGLPMLLRSALSAQVCDGATHSHWFYAAQYMRLPVTDL